MELLKRKRGGFTGAITRVFNKGTLTQEEDYSSLNLGQLERQVESIRSAGDASYRKLHDELLETLANDVNYDEESDNLEQHEESVEKALSVVHQLIAVFKVHSNSIQILAKLDSLERQMKDQPEKSFQSVISKLQERYEAVEDILRDS